MTRQARLERSIARLTIVVPTLGTLAAVGAAVAGRAPTTLDLIVLVALVVLTELGVTAGFHRLFTHRAYRAASWVRGLLGVLGSMSAQGPLVAWVAVHRRHHQDSDGEGDPHSPERGLLHAHLGWMLEHQPEDWRRYAPDVVKDRQALRLTFAYPWYVAAGLVLPAVAGALAGGGALVGFLWGGMVRIFVVHHATWSVNSIAHRYGRRPFATRDRSRNNAVVAALTLGEGWHNNHHAFPTSARHGLTPWQVDPTYLFIRALAWLGLAQAVHVPTARQLDAHREPKETTR